MQLKQDFKKLCAGVLAGTILLTGIPWETASALGYKDADTSTKVEVGDVLQAGQEYTIDSSTNIIGTFVTDKDTNDEVINTTENKFLFPAGDKNYRIEDIKITAAAGTGNATCDSKNLQLDISDDNEASDVQIAINYKKVGSKKYFSGLCINPKNIYEHNYTVGGTGELIITDLISNLGKIRDALDKSEESIVTVTSSSGAKYICNVVQDTAGNLILQSFSFSGTSIAFSCDLSELFGDSFVIIDANENYWKLDSFVTYDGTTSSGTHPNFRYIVTKRVDDAATVPNKMGLTFDIMKDAVISVGDILQSNKSYTVEHADSTTVVLDNTTIASTLNSKVTLPEADYNYLVNDICIDDQEVPKLNDKVVKKYKSIKGTGISDSKALIELYYYQRGNEVYFQSLKVKKSSSALFEATALVDNIIDTVNAMAPGYSNESPTKLIASGEYSISDHNSACTYTIDIDDNNNIVISSIVLSGQFLGSLDSSVKISLSDLLPDSDVLLIRSTGNYDYIGSSAEYKMLVYNGVDDIGISYTVNEFNAGCIGVVPINKESTLHYNMYLGDELEGGKVYYSTYFQRALGTDNKYLSVQDPSNDRNNHTLLRNYNSGSSTDWVSPTSVGLKPYNNQSSNSYKEDSYSPIGTIPIYIDGKYSYDISAASINLSQFFTNNDDQDYVCDTAGDTLRFTQAFSKKTRLDIAIGTPGANFGAFKIKLPEGRTYHYQGAKPIMSELVRASGNGSSNTATPFSARFALYFSTTVPDNVKIEYCDKDTGKFLFSKNASDGVIITDEDVTDNPALQDYDISTLYKSDISDEVFSSTEILSDTRVYVKSLACHVFYYRYGSIEDKDSLALAIKNYNGSILPKDTETFYSAYSYRQYNYLSETSSFKRDLDNYNLDVLVDRDTGLPVTTVYKDPMNVVLIPKDTKFTVSYYGRTADSSTPTKIFDIQIPVGENGGLTEDDLANHPELAQYNYVTKYLADSDKLPAELKTVVKDVKVILPQKISVTIKDFDSDAVLSQQEYASGSGKADIDFTSDDFSDYYPVIGSKDASGKFVKLTDSDTKKLTKDTTFYVKKLDQCYKVNVKVEDANGHSLADRVSVFRSDDPTLVPSFYTYTYDEDSDTFNSDATYSTTFNFKILADWVTNQTKDTDGLDYTSSYSVSLQDNGETLSAPVVTDTHDSSTVTCTFDKDTKTVNAVVKFAYATATINHEYYDSVDTTGSPDTTISEVDKSLAGGTQYIPTLELPGYQYVSGDGDQTHEDYTGDNTYTNKYVKDESYTNGFSVMVQDITGKTIDANLSVQSNDGEEVTSGVGPTTFKNLDGGEYALVADQQPMGTVSVEGDTVTFDSNDSDGCYAVESADTDHDMLNVVLQKTTRNLTVLDEINGKEYTRFSKKVNYGDTYSVNPLSAYSDNLVSAPAVTTGTLTDDTTLLFTYDDKASTTSKVTVKVLDENGNVHGSDTVMLGDTELPVGIDGSYSASLIADGTYKLSLNGEDVGSVSLKYANSVKNTFTLAEDCTKYVVDSTDNSVSQEFTIVLKVRSGSITVVDHYDDSDHVRQTDNYAIGATYTYNALDLAGYTVDGDSSKTGTVSNDAETIVFNYKKSSSGDSGGSGGSGGSGSLPSTPDTKPDTKPDDAKPDDSNKPDTKPDIKPDESGMSAEDINKMDLDLLLACGLGGNSTITLKWLKVSDATSYDVYVSYCNGKHKFKKAATVSAKKQVVTFKGLDNSKKYKFFVTASKTVNGKKKHLAKSNYLHVAMKNSNMTNAKKVTVNKSTVTLTEGKTFTIKPSIKYERLFKKPVAHTKTFRYYTTNSKVAKVSKAGKITAKNKGKCTIYVMANNGRWAKINVTVK